jgi:thiol-disulfide isomerase/thioredoxin
MAPEIVTKDIKGQNFSLDQLKGKYILIDFWASWCGPCRQAIPHLKELYKKYHPNGLEVVTLSLDDRPVEWTEAVSKEKLNDFYNILVDTKIKKDYLNAIMPIPNQILIDRSGKIIWNTVHKKENESIDDILRQYVN